MHKTETPLTDAYYQPNGETIRRINSQDGYEFARRLERERGELIGALRNVLADAHAGIRSIKEDQARALLAKMKEAT